MKYSSNRDTKCHWTSRLNEIFQHRVSPACFIPTIQYITGTWLPLSSWLVRCMHDKEVSKNKCSPEGAKLASLGLEIKFCNASINGILGLWKFKHFHWFWNFGFWRKEKGSSEHSSDREHRFCILHYRQLVPTMKECVRLGLPLRQPSHISLEGKKCYVKWQFLPLVLLLFWHSHKLITGHRHSEQCPCL